MSSEDLIALGQQSVADGSLAWMRAELGLTRNAMADFLFTSPLTYQSWEENTAKIRASTAERIGRFMVRVTAQLDSLTEHGISIKSLMPMHEVAGALGVPQELLLKRYREEKFRAEDLGLLGLWVWRDELVEIGHVMHG